MSISLLTYFFRLAFLRKKQISQISTPPSLPPLPTHHRFTSFHPPFSRSSIFFAFFLNTSVHLPVMVLVAHKPSCHRHLSLSCSLTHTTISILHKCGRDEGFISFHHASSAHIRTLSRCRHVFLFFFFVGSNESAPESRALFTTYMHQG